MGLVTLQKQLASCARVFLDTMVFIYVLEDHPALGEASAIILNTIERGECLGITSVLTLTELLTAPAQQGDETAFLDYQLYLHNFPNLSIHEITFEMGCRAASVRGRTGLPTPDALQIAVAQETQVDAIVTNDRRWRNGTGPIPLILLDDFVSPSDQPQSR